MFSRLYYWIQCCCAGQPSCCAGHVEHTRYIASLIMNKVEIHHAKCKTVSESNRTVANWKLAKMIIVTMTITYLGVGMHRFSGLFQFFLCPICWQAWYSTGSHIIAEKDATVTYYAEFRKRLQPYLLIYGFWQNINLARIIQSSEKAAAFSADIRLPAEYQYGLYYTEFRKCCSRLILFGFKIRLRTALIIQSSEKAAAVSHYSDFTHHFR